MNKKYIDAYTLTQKYGQNHLLQYYDILFEEEKDSLLDDILSIDFTLMKSLYENTNKQFSPDSLIIEPIKYTEKSKLSESEKKDLYNTGLSSISKGKMCAVTMAGGQGSRLGHNGPKGTYDIGLPSHKSLFEIQCDGLKEICRESGYSVPWYIMTSITNHDETVSFFERNNYFGYDKNDIVFFSQSMIPVMNDKGKILLESPFTVLKSPNGNGGLFHSLKEKNILYDMKKRGIEWIFICGVDNCLVKMADPYFLGFNILENHKVSAKSFLKRDAGEKAGVFCYRNKRPYVIEYTEIPENYANLKDEKGNWVYGDTNVLNYIFHIDQVSNIADKGLPYHVAVKSVSAYIDGNTVKSEKPDSYKFEMFLFDSFSMLDDIGVFRIERREEFAPVKNKTGIDSAESAREMYLNIHGNNS